eukprot:Protomagalhaensia_wolfi_Nauph_80__2205@NODE_2427_length_1094_cov_122_589573_g1901_i0_p1_GENE_NODE_2427_length_1094_cov_122_589573_g1901_i0NODE_2427_length_1094_cov_122_589573_g1901_i0_p1_ORF_typecomplete_len331_score51_73Glyco_transf_6/PF03414_13/4e02Glyco_transf_6/PF03414_13/0_21_NODE_2427_length_1094_cov_122_589573_g1901_i0100975
MEASPTRLLFFVAAALAVELTISRKLKGTPVPEVETIIEGLTLVASESFEFLTDLSQLAGQVIKSAKDSGTTLNHAQLSAIILTDSVKQRLAHIKREALRTLSIADPDTFDSWTENYMENDRVRGFVDGIDMMIDDAVNGTLPLMPYFEPRPSPSQDEVLRIMSEMQSAQRESFLHIFSQAIEAEGLEDCASWLEPYELSLDSSHLPSHISQSMRVAIKSIEERILLASAHLVGDRRNFLQIIAVCHRDADFERKRKIMKAIVDEDLKRGIARLCGVRKDSAATDIHVLGG